ncbi:hypothetical protein ACQY0O_000616 [Thecaphora frezii]
MGSPLTQPSALRSPSPSSVGASASQPPCSWIEAVANLHDADGVEGLAAPGDDAARLHALLTGRPTRAAQPPLALKSTAPRHPYPPTHMRLSSMAAICVAEQLRPANIPPKRAGQGFVERSDKDAYRAVLEANLAILPPASQTLVARHLFIRVCIDALRLQEPHCRHVDSAYAIPFNVMHAAYKDSPQLLADAMADTLQLLLWTVDRQCEVTERYSGALQESWRFRSFLDRSLLIESRQGSWDPSRSLRSLQMRFASESLVRLQRRGNCPSRATLADVRQGAIDDWLCDDFLARGPVSDNDDNNDKSSNEYLHGSSDKLPTGLYSQVAPVAQLQEKSLGCSQPSLFIRVMDEALHRSWLQARRVGPCQARSSPLPDVRGCIDALASLLINTLAWTLPAVQQDSPCHPIEQVYTWRRWAHDVPPPDQLAMFAEWTSRLALQLWDDADDDAAYRRLDSDAAEFRMLMSRLAMDAGCYAVAYDFCRWSRAEGSQQRTCQLYFESCVSHSRHQEHRLWQSTLTDSRQCMDGELVLRLQAIQRHMLWAPRYGTSTDVLLSSTIGRPEAAPCMLPVEPLAPDEETAFRCNLMLSIAVAQHIAGLYINESRALAEAIAIPVATDGEGLEWNEPSHRASLLEADRRAELLVVEELRKAEAEAERALRRRQIEDAEIAETCRQTWQAGKRNVVVQNELATPAPKPKKKDWTYDEAMDTWVLATPTIDVRGSQGGAAAQAVAGAQLQLHLAQRGTPRSGPGDDDQWTHKSNTAQGTRGGWLSDSTSGYDSGPTFDLMRSLRKKKRECKGQVGRGADGTTPNRTLAPRSPVSTRRSRPSGILAGDEADSDDELDLFRAKTPPPKRRPTTVQRYDSGREGGRRTSMSGDHSRGADDALQADRASNPLMVGRGLERSSSLGELPFLARSHGPALLRAGSLRRTVSTSSTTGVQQRGRTSTGSGDLEGRRRAARAPRQSWPRSAIAAAPEDEDEDFEPDTDVSYGESSDSQEAETERETYVAPPYSLRSRRANVEAEAAPVGRVLRSKRRRTEATLPRTSIEVVIPVASTQKPHRRFTMLDLSP